jgi:hypothetical protein
MIESDVPAVRAPQQRSVIFDARRLTEALRAASPPLLFGLRLWASVCLALYIAFCLELPNAYWAGTTAAIVSAASRRVAAQGLVPYDWDHRWGRLHRGADRVFSAKDKLCMSISRAL